LRQQRAKGRALRCWGSRTDEPALMEQANVNQHHAGPRPTHWHSGCRRPTCRTNWSTAAARHHGESRSRPYRGALRPQHNAAEDAGELRAQLIHCDISVPAALSIALETAFTARPSAYRRGFDEAYLRFALVDCK